MRGVLLAYEVIWDCEYMGVGEGVVCGVVDGYMGVDDGVVCGGSGLVHGCR